MIAVRELSKNLALLAPVRFTETLLNYSVLQASGSALLPRRVISGISKDSYFEEVYRQLDPKKPLLFLEFGVYQGKSIRKWAAMDGCSESRFVGFDSFVGLPERWRQRPPGYFNAHGIAPELNDPRVMFMKGWFNRTLSEWLSRYADTDTYLPVVHIDSDLYSSALYVLTRLDDVFRRYYILFDDYGAGEARALRDYLTAYGSKFRPLLGRKRRWYSRVPGQVFGRLETEYKSRRLADQENIAAWSEQTGS